jgi:hypothetical protein
VAEARIKAFCVDFNWDLLDRFASPGLYGHADPRRHLEWYRDLGVNTIQSFFVSHNGYAWYASDVAPRTPGMVGDFFGDLTRMGHEAGMRVMGYLSPGANGDFAVRHPELSQVPNWKRWHMPLSMPYLDYLARMLEDALRKVPVDGFMVDMLWNADPVWMDCERQMFRELMGESLGERTVPDAEATLAMNRRATERAWRRIRDVAKGLNPDLLIWLSVNNMTNAQLEQTVVPREVDWLMNENPRMEEGLAIARRLAGPATQVVQCACGWEGVQRHDAAAILAALPADVGIYGFAQPDAVTTLPEPDGGVNARNVDAMRRLFRAG